MEFLHSALKCEQGKGVDMSQAVTNQAIILKSELGRLNKWAPDGCSEIKRHISQAEKSVLKKEQLLWWRAMLKKAGPVCDNISQLLVTAESLLEVVSTSLVSAKKKEETATKKSHREHIREAKCQEGDD